MTATPTPKPKRKVTHAPPSPRAQADARAELTARAILRRAEAMRLRPGAVQVSTMAKIVATLADMPTRPDRARGYRAPKPPKEAGQRKGPEPKSGAPVPPAKASAPSVAPEAGQ